MFIFERRDELREIFARKGEIIIVPNLLLEGSIENTRGLYYTKYLSWVIRALFYRLHQNAAFVLFNNEACKRADDPTKALTDLMEHGQTIFYSFCSSRWARNLIFDA